MKRVYLFVAIILSFISTKAQVIIGTAHLYKGISATTYNKNNKIKVAIPDLQNKFDKANATLKNSDTTRSAFVTALADFNKAKADLDNANANNISITAPPKIKPVAGVFSFPFKYRPQSGIMETNFSLSLVGGVEFTNDPLNDSTSHTFSAYIGIGQSSITLNPSNSSVTSNTTRSAVTFSFTFLYEWQGLQFAISTGIDNNLDNGSDKWSYQSKAWISAGIGFSIFTQSKK